VAARSAQRIPAARAGFFVSPVCADSSEVLAFFAEGSDFSGLPNCESLCKKAYGRCKEFLARSRSCEQATVAMGAFFEKETDCDPNPDPEARKTCRQILDANAQAARQSIKAEDQAAKDECAEIRDGCSAACAAPD
jgi:hypothetical protein